MAVHDDRVMVVSGHLVMLYEPDLPQEQWGFKEAGPLKIIDKGGMGGRYIEYHNTPYRFNNEAVVRFLALKPPTRKQENSEKEEYYYRFDKFGRKIQQIPYSVMADCEELGWQRMSILPTINFHEAIQRHFRERGIEDEQEVCHHLWRVYKGRREGYTTGMWGIAYYRADYYEPLVGEDPRQPVESSPWLTVPRADRLLVELKEKVLPYFPTAPTEDAYIREIMERLGAEYMVAKALFDTRRDVGLP